MGSFVPNREVLEIFAKIGHPGKGVLNPVAEWPFEKGSPRLGQDIFTIEKFTLLSDSDEGPSSNYEYNFVYKIHDGALVVTKQKFTHEEFERFACEINIEEFEAVAFTQAVRIK